MIGSIISGIVSQLTYDVDPNNITPTFYQGARDELNKTITEENDAFIFLIRPVKWTSEIKNSKNVDTKYNISVGFFKTTDFAENRITDIDTVLDLLTTLYQDFFKEVFNQSDDNNQNYDIENLAADEVYNDESFDNNVSGILSTFTFVVKNEYNVCN